MFLFKVILLLITLIFAFDQGSIQDLLVKLTGDASFKSYRGFALKLCRGRISGYLDFLIMMPVKQQYKQPPGLASFLHYHLEDT